MPLRKLILKSSGLPRRGGSSRYFSLEKKSVNSVYYGGSWTVRQSGILAECSLTVALILMEVGLGSAEKRL